MCKGPPVLYMRLQNISTLSKKSKWLLWALLCTDLIPGNSFPPCALSSFFVQEHIRVDFVIRCNLSLFGKVTNASWAKTTRQFTDCPFTRDGICESGETKSLNVTYTSLFFFSAGKWFDDHMYCRKLELFIWHVCSEHFSMNNFYLRLTELRVMPKFRCSMKWKVYLDWFQQWWEEYFKSFPAVQKPTQQIIRNAHIYKRLV